MVKFSNGKITTSTILYNRGVPQKYNNFVYIASANYNMIKRVFRFDSNNICYDRFWDKVIETEYSNLDAPHGATYCEGTGYTYIVSTNINNIYKINNNNSSDITLIATKNNGIAGPVSFLINSTSTYAYITNFDNNTVTRLNLINDTCENLILNNINNISIKGLNGGCLVDDNTLLIACSISNNIIKIILDSADSLNGTVTKFGNDILTPVDVKPYINNNEFIVSSFLDFKIYVIDSNGNKRVLTSGIIYPRMFSANLDNYVFVSTSPTSDSPTSYIVKINLVTGKIEPFIPNCIQKKYFNPARAIHIDPGSPYMYIANQKSGKVYKINQKYLLLNF